MSIPLFELPAATLPTTCWFCQQRTPEPACAVKVPMYGDVIRSVYRSYPYTTRQAKWHKRTITVPRCAPCKAAHDLAWLSAHLGLFIAIAGIALFAGFVLLLAGLAPPLAVGPVIAGAVFLGVGAFSVLQPLRSMRTLKRRLPLGGTRPRAAENEFPEVLSWRRQGWRVGIGPPRSEI